MDKNEASRLNGKDVRVTLLRGGVCEGTLECLNASCWVGNFRYAYGGIESIEVIG